MQVDLYNGCKTGGLVGHSQFSVFSAMIVLVITRNVITHSGNLEGFLIGAQPNLK